MPREVFSLTMWPGPTIHITDSSGQVSSRMFGNVASTMLLLYGFPQESLRGLSVAPEAPAFLRLQAVRRATKKPCPRRSRAQTVQNMPAPFLEGRNIAGAVDRTRPDCVIQPGPTVAGQCWTLTSFLVQPPRGGHSQRWAIQFLTGGATTA